MCEQVCTWTRVLEWERASLLSGHAGAGGPVSPRGEPLLLPNPVLSAVQVQSSGGSAQEPSLRGWEGVAMERESWEVLTAETSEEAGPPEAENHWREQQEHPTTAPCYSIGETLPSTIQEILREKLHLKPSEALKGYGQL